MRSPGVKAGPASSRPPLPQHEAVYRVLREALVVGRFPPGREVSLRKLAAELGAGVMPVREAVRRLAAEQALEVSGTRRARIPVMDRPRFDELMQARLLLEPECAVRALPAIDAPRLRRIRDHDRRLNESLRGGAPELYLASNHAFHFEIYRAARSDVFVPMLESLWTRFGPFMRMVYDVVGTASLTDKHALAIEAIERRDGAALRAAVRGDIIDGMRLLGRTMFPAVLAAPAAGLSPADPLPRIDKRVAVSRTFSKP